MLASRTSAKVHIAAIEGAYLVASPSSSVPCGEPVPGAAHRLYQSLQQEGLERLAQPADVHIHGALFHIGIAAPDAIEQLAAREHPLRVSHEKMQQAILRGAQGDFPLAGADPVARVV